MATQAAAIIMGNESPAEPALKVWICAPHAEIPDWVAERMTSDRAPDGTFDIDASDGVVRVERGFAVFAQQGQVFACLPRQMQEKLATIAGDHPAVQELREKTAAMASQKAEHRSASKSRVKAERAAGNLNLKPMIGEPCAPQFAGLDRLNVDDSYQRSIEGGASKKLIEKIAINWDWRLCLPLLVSRRQGELFVIDGQHRLEAARLRGDIQHVPVVVFDFDDPKAEAELFVQANRSRRAIGQLDDFHAAVASGDRKALAVHEVVTGAGLVVGRNQAWQYLKAGEVVFVTAVQRALNAQGRPAAEAAMQTLARAFDGQILIGAGAVFDALCNLIHERQKANDPIDLALMEIVLAEVGLSGWKEAVDGIDGGKERAEVMLRELRTAYAEAVSA